MWPSRDELIGWVNSMDAHKDGPQDEQLRVYSASRDMRHRGVQPDVMSELAVEAGRRDGFLERILWDVPAVKPAR